VVRAIPRGIEERTVASYIIDKSHSEALFQVRHLVTKLGGRFNDFEGTLTFEEGNPGASSVSMTLQAASIDTNNQDRDNHLRSVDFFDVEKFPLITFQSTSVTGGGSDYHVVGNLTLHG
jgi:polyisoprenoid-binding protein YceI